MITNPNRTKVTVGQVARLYGVHHGKVLTWINQGELRAINVATNPRGKRPRWLIDPADLEAFEARRANAQPNGKAKRRKTRPVSVTRYF